MFEVAPEGHEALMANILQCDACRLRLTRNNAVLYRGPVPSSLMLVGESPGLQEDQFGKPFVGPSGQVLSRLLARAGVPEESIYFCNVVKCRPPANRNPSEAEIRCCRPWLVEQARLVKPSIIVSLGKTATSALTTERGPMNVLLEHEDLTCTFCKDIPVIPVYHPAYLLRRLDDPASKPILEDTVRRLALAWRRAT